MICRCVPLLVLVAMLMLFSVAKHSLWPEAGAGWWIEAAADDGYSELSLCKRFARAGESRFEPFRTITTAACPGLGPVFVTTITTRMSVLYRQEIKIFLPIRTLFFQWRVAKASLHPMRLALGIHACHLHIVR